MCSDNRMLYVVILVECCCISGLMLHTVVHLKVAMKVQQATATPMVVLDTTTKLVTVQVLHMLGMVDLMDLVVQVMALQFTYSSAHGIFCDTAVY